MEVGIRVLANPDSEECFWRTRIGKGDFYRHEQAFRASTRIRSNNHTDEPSFRDFDRLDAVRIRVWPVTELLSNYVTGVNIIDLGKTYA